MADGATEPLEPGTNQAVVDIRRRGERKRLDGRQHCFELSAQAYRTTTFRSVPEFRGNDNADGNASGLKCGRTTRIPATRPSHEIGHGVRVQHVLQRWHVRVDLRPWWADPRCLETPRPRGSVGIAPRQERVLAERVPRPDGRPRCISIPRPRRTRGRGEFERPGSARCETGGRGERRRERSGDCLAYTIARAWSSRDRQGQGQHGRHVARTQKKRAPMLQSQAAASRTQNRAPLHIAGLPGDSPCPRQVAPIRVLQCRVGEGGKIGPAFGVSTRGWPGRPAGVAVLKHVPNVRSRNVSQIPKPLSMYLRQ